VSAAAALIRVLNPDIPALGVIRILKQTARRPTGTWTTDLGWGILDAGAALELARRVDVTPPTTVATAARRTHQRSLVVRWTGTDPARAGLIPSGLANVSLYVGRDGKKPHFYKRTTHHTIRVAVRPGSVYRFYTIGVDKAGNRQRTSRSVRTRALR
jgi:hypothetical protein